MIADNNTFNPQHIVFNASQIGTIGVAKHYLSALLIQFKFEPQIQLKASQVHLTETVNHKYISFSSNNTHII